MTTSLVHWKELLHAVVPAENKKSPGRICLVKYPNEEATYEIFSKDEFINFHKKHPAPAWRRKLTLYNLVEISKKIIENLVTCPETTPEHLRVIDHTLAIWHTKQLLNDKDVLNPNYIASVENHLGSVREMSDIITNIRKDLKIIVRWARTKRYNKKKNSLWARIKYILWRFFYDKSEELKELYSTRPKFKVIVKVAHHFISDRLMSAMRAFKEKMKSKATCQISLGDPRLALRRWSNSSTASANEEAQKEILEMQAMLNAAEYIRNLSEESAQKMQSSLLFSEVER